MAFCYNKPTTETVELISQKKFCMILQKEKKNDNRYTCWQRSCQWRLKEHSGVKTPNYHWCVMPELDNTKMSTGKLMIRLSDQLLLISSKEVYLEYYHREKKALYWCSSDNQWQY